MLNVVHLSRNEMGQSLDDDDSNDIQIGTGWSNMSSLSSSLKIYQQV